MLDSYIIDAIRRQERERDQRAQLEIRAPDPHPVEDTTPEEEAERGVVIIPLDPDVPLREDSAA